jgi:RNA polymerase sigma-70 factor (ECF subfamily)
MNANTDQIYIDKVLQGETNAFAYLVNRHKNMVFTLAYNMVKCREDAEEIAQDSFLKAFQQLHTFKGNSKYSTWLYTIVYRNSISMLRKKKIKTSDIDDRIVANYSTDIDFSQLESLKDQDQKKYVKLIIESLPETDAFLITLFYLNENSLDEIEEITGLSKSNIKVKLFRLRKKLYKELSLLLKEEIKELL